jgi:MSHA biogenesis protein MshJ
MFNNLQAKFEALTQREKIIVVIAVLAIIWFGWDNLFYQPTHQKQQTLQNKLISLKQQITDQQLAAIKLENSDHTDFNLNKHNELAALKAEYDRLQELMMQGDKSFAPPHLMSTVLSDILNKNNKLTLIKLDTLPVTTLLKSKQPHPIYKHGLAITFSGSYLDTLNYLIALESLPWHFIWESIDYQVKNYPIAETTITTYTLSFKESWLGV